MSTAKKSSKRGDILIDRVYDARKGEGVPDGAECFLVDRLWPRGVSRGRAALDEWAKDATPSTALVSRLRRRSSALICSQR